MKNSKRARKAGIAVGIAALATMAFGAGSAQAVPFANTFDNGFLKTTFPGNGFDVIEPTTPAGGAEPPASIAGDLDLGTGVLTIPPGCTAPSSPGVHNGVGFCFPDFSGTVSGIPISVSLTTTEVMTATVEGGVIAPTGGATTSTTDFTAVLDVAGDICTISPIELTFSTADTAYPVPYDGDLFDVPFHTGMDYPPLQNGAIQASWTSLPAATPAPGDDCSLVNGLTGGQGGLWIAEGLTTPAVNQPPAAPDIPVGGGIVPKTDDNNKQKTKKKCKKKKGKKGASSAAKGKNCGKKKKKKK